MGRITIRVARGRQEEEDTKDKSLLAKLSIIIEGGVCWKFRNIKDL